MKKKKGYKLYTAWNTLFSLLIKFLKSKRRDFKIISLNTINLAIFKIFLVLLKGTYPAV